MAFAGDFNSWAVDWGSKETNALLEAMSTLEVVLLNSGEEPTFTRGEASSIVDLTFVSSSLVNRNYSWKVMNTYTASDHFAILWEVSTNRNTKVPPTRTNAIGWKISAFDLDAFTVALDNKAISGIDARNKAEELMRRIREACDASMPRKYSLIQLPSVYWWNDNIAALRKKCLKARRASQRG